MPYRQAGQLIIPTYAQQVLGAATISIASAAQVASDALGVWARQEKSVKVFGTAVGGVTPLQGWIEHSTTAAAGTWTMIGVPVVLVATGSFPLLWTAHSEFFRVVLQVPLWVAGSWTVFVTYEAK